MENLQIVPVTLSEIKEKGNMLFEQDKNNWLVRNLLTGVTKYGVFGEEFFDINDRIVNLDIPFLDDNAKTQVTQLINENLDKEGRSYKNAMKMMTEDGIHLLLPKSDDAWNKF